jgi:addiction module HigA family antidote
MKKQTQKIQESQVLTEKMDVGTKEFDEFQAMLLNRSKKRTLPQQKKIELMALTFEMQDYLKSKDQELKLVGDFLKIHLKTFGIKQNKFASYIGLKPSNLSKLISGERTLSHELALVFGTIFKNDPMLWLDIQDKNKLDQLHQSKKQKLNQYSLEDLL